MPIKVKQEDGTEVEAFTAEEVTAQKEAEAKRVGDEKQTELDALNEQKVAVEAELAKEKEKDKNFENLRRKAEGKGAELNEELQKQIADINKKIDAVAARPIEDTVQEFIKTKVGEDKEKVKLFNYYFKQLGSDAKTKEEILKASNDALVLTTNGEYKPSLDSRMMSAGADANYRGDNQEEISDQSKEFAKVFGNSEKELVEQKKKKK